MALPGMRSTADFAADERPKNWRENILLLEPRNGAPLAALTAAMKSEVTDDAQFYWWEEGVDLLNYTIDGAIAGTVEETMVVDAQATRLTAGDTLRNSRTGEVIRVISITNDTTFEAQRGVGGSTAAAINDNDKLLFIGSAYREGAPRSKGTSFNPTKKTNVTQIFRDPVEWTRTAMKTRLRSTKDAMKEDRRRALNKHMVGMERAFWLGEMYETLEDGQPLRFTGGLLSFLPAANDVAVQGAGGALDMDELMSLFPDIFAYGGSEKLAFTSLKVMAVLGEVVRKNSQYQWGPNEKEFGMNVKRLYSPAGTLVLTEHPLFGQAGDFLAEDMVILDTTKLRYRYVDDTSLQKDREERGTDGKAEEYITECGLEVHNAETMYRLRGIKSAAADA